MQLSSQQRQQPFFKSTTTSALTTSSSGSYFLNFNTSSSKNGSQNTFSQSQTASRSASGSGPGVNFFHAPNNTVSRQKDSERETTHSTERLSALHNKLHQEAEKIRKWKTKTDLELNDKGKKLQDANMTIECQRKSIVELQLQNEKLSSKMQEELAGHVELDHKATATRELCNVLKDQVFRIDEAVTAGEQDREELHFTEKKHLEKFQDLVVKFQELEIQHSTKYNEMKDKLQKQNERHEGYVAESRQNIQEKDQQIVMLSDEKVEKEMKISQLVKDLGENWEHLDVIKRDEALLKDRLKKSESIITSKDIQLKSANERLVYAQDENKELTGKVCEIERTCAQFLEEKISVKNMLQEQENEQKLKENSFNSNIANLQNEIEDHLIRIKDLLSQNENLTSTVQDRQTELDSLKLDHENMQTEVGQLKTCNNEFKVTQVKLLKDLDEVRAENKGLLDSKRDLFNSEKKLEQEKDELATKLGNADKEIKGLRQEIKTLKETDAKLTKNILKFTEENQKLGNEVAQLQQQLQEKNKEINETLDNEISTSKTLREQLAKETNILEKQIKTLKSDIAAQTKKNKVLEKKNDTLQIEFAKIETGKEKLMNEISSLKDGISKKDKENKKQINEVKRLNKIVEEAEKASKASKDSFERERQELCTTLENYKVENERIVAQKERELSDFKLSKGNEIEDQKKRIRSLENNLECSKQSKKDLENETTEKLKEKAKEIDSLKKKMENMELSTSPMPNKKDYVAETPTQPQIMPMTPRTPRSILRCRTDKPTKKRKVVFSSSSNMANYSSDDDSNYQLFKSNSPKKVKNSVDAIPTKAVRPNVRHSPGPVNQTSHIKKPLKQVSRNLKKTGTENQHEMEQIRELLPGISSNTPQKKDMGKKTPFKARITKISPRKAGLDVDWFDNDDFFAFDG